MARAGLTSAEHAEIKRLKGENAELRCANEILKAASASSAAELDRPQPRS
jgi:transposase